MMATGAASLEDRSSMAMRRMLRPTALLLVLALHAALLLLASRWQVRVDPRTEQSLIFLPLPGRVQEPAETPPAVRNLPRETPAPARSTQLIIIPKETPPPQLEETLPPHIDWRAEAALTAKQLTESATAPGPRALDRRGDDLYVIGGLEAEANARPEFGWYHARTHRIEAIEGGGSILWLNDRCFIVMAGLIPFPMCGIGKIPPRSDLFDHMRDPP